MMKTTVSFRNRRLVMVNSIGVLAFSIVIPLFIVLYPVMLGRTESVSDLFAIFSELLTNDLIRYTSLWFFGNLVITGLMFILIISKKSFTLSRYYGVVATGVAAILIDLIEFIRPYLSGLTYFSSGNIFLMFAFPLHALLLLVILFQKQIELIE